MNGMRRLYAEPIAHTAPTEQSGGKKDKQNERTNEKKKHETVGKKSEIINTNGDPNYCGRILKRVSCTYMNL